MAAIDKTHRKLKFPPRFLPYLEKHRIFELLHECVELLVQVRPKDHVQFLKTILPCAAMKKDKQRIVFLAPYSFDREKFAELVADCLGIQAVSRLYLEMLTREKMQKEEIRIQEIDESIEEGSCICIGEGEEEGDIFYPVCYPTEDDQCFVEMPSDQTLSSIQEEEEEQEEEEIVEEEEKEEGDENQEKGEDEGEEELCEPEPCECVCPCVNPAVEKFLQGKTSSDFLRELEKEFEEPLGVPVEEHEERHEEGHTEGYQRGHEEEQEKEHLGEHREEQHGEGEEWGGENLPCERPKHKKKRKPKKPPPTEVTQTPSSSIIDIDYGLLADCELAAKGWILIDFPTTGEEGEKLNALGVIPTHALRIIINEDEEAKDREYKFLVQSWTKTYKFVPVMEIRMGERDILELSRDMCRLLSYMPHRHAPMLPRIVLIGSRGSGVTTQAQKLSKKYKMVHVEFEIVKARALEQDDELSKLYKFQLENRVDPELEALLLERVLLTSACRNRGWVLTGYPQNVDQMRMLDIIATPPNRVIFLEVPARECFVRLYYRKTDPCLGDEYKIPQVEPFGVHDQSTPGLGPEVASRLVSHPKNNKKQIIYDIEQYFLEKTEMMNYCGKTAAHINGDKPVDRVFELIEQVIINSAPPHPPREPLVVNHGIEESHERLKKFRLASGMYFNNMFLNPPERLVRI